MRDLFEALLNCQRQRAVAEEKVAYHCGDYRSTLVLTTS
jgi:hypothetical protein